MQSSLASAYFMLCLLVKTCMVSWVEATDCCSYSLEWLQWCVWVMSFLAMQLTCDLHALHTAVRLHSAHCHAIAFISWLLAVAAALVSHLGCLTVLPSLVFVVLVSLSKVASVLRCGCGDGGCDVVQYYVWPASAITAPGHGAWHCIPIVKSATGD